jgi:hypothetical protein
MRRAAGTYPKIVVVAILTIPLAGCLLNGKPTTAVAPPAAAPKPAAPAPAPEPLSIPQTDIQLPAPQPVPQEALNTAAPELAAAPAPAKPAAPPPRTATPRAAATTKPADTQPAVEPETPPRAPIQEILSPDEQRAYREKARKYQSDTRAVLSKARNLSPNQKSLEQEIDNFLKQSESTGDLRLAVQLAERAYTLAKELQSGK